MAKIIFYEKPGCAENQKQKNYLVAAGYEIEARDLTAEHWTPAGLRAFFADKPVAEWFDPRAPQILSGEIDPKVANPQAALVMMSVNPSLIKSPLVMLDGRCGSGLDGAELEVFLGVKARDRIRHPASTTPQAWPGEHDHS
jgi:nitrogenase-associated protein